MGKIFLNRQPPRMLAETLRKLATNIDNSEMSEQPSNLEAENYLRAYKKYCSALGIGKYDVDLFTSGAHRTADEERGTTSFDQRLRRDYRWQYVCISIFKRFWNALTRLSSTVQYWFVASIANGMLWSQIIIGAAITALGATHANGSKTATIYLGAASTVIAGFLTYFKSRNQPNRSRQFRQALRKVRNKMGECCGILSVNGRICDQLTGHAF